MDNAPIAIIAGNDAGAWPMGTVCAQNLHDKIFARLKPRAAKHGCPAEAEAHVIPQPAVMGNDEPGFEELAARMRALTAGRAHTPTEVLQREGRDER